MTDLNLIKKNADRLLKEIPPNVTLLAAAKTRSLEEVRAACDAGIHAFGHNYVQEAHPMIVSADFKADWHMIGHLQRNKAGMAVEIFDVVESLDSMRLANELEKRCGDIGKVMDVLIEVNSGAEDNKTGILPQEVLPLAQLVDTLPYLRLTGLMTMGPLSGDAELSRPYFKNTCALFDQLKGMHLSNSAISVLSMGMSGSYKVAIEEGATMVRIGTLLFGPRLEL